MKTSIESNLLKALFRNVYFINGTAYAGKSTAVKNLAERFGGICCGENYHDSLTPLADPEHQPNLCYFQTMSGWEEFLTRTPGQYASWIDGISREAAELEILMLIHLTQQHPDKPIFVDTNIHIETLREISDYHHVAVMLSDQSTSVDRFFERSDPEKQFLFHEIGKTSNPESTMANFRACIAKINSPENYRNLEESGFFVLRRDENRTQEETCDILAKHFRL